MVILGRQIEMWALLLIIYFDPCHTTTIINSNWLYHLFIANSMILHFFAFECQLE